MMSASACEVSRDVAPPPPLAGEGGEGVLV